MKIYTLHSGCAPLLISLPHNGTDIPASIQQRMTPSALRTPDTDWHIARLYAFAHELGATLLEPHYSRYVVDLNRPPDGVALYPGQSETGLCPVQTFAREPIYKSAQEPSSDEIQSRVSQYWRPYHEALRDELSRLMALHKRVVLWEAHSIRSQVPLFFEGRLPDLNLGTADGTSCSSELQQQLVDELQVQQDYSWVVNGRFKGGYITRHYGRLNANIDAVQLELAQTNYMDEDSFVYFDDKAKKLQLLIKKLILKCIKK